MTPSAIVFKQIRVNQMAQNSGVFIGINNASFWGSYAKTQTGQELSGANATRNRAYFSDKDVLDAVAFGPAALVAPPSSAGGKKGRKAAKPRKPAGRRKRSRKRKRDG
ncbi:hypothetical protein [Paenibacillus sp. GYB003]|uniref:hypothetical protein n=1 Tax=Paenibacillus sp. GYB003 TaxID=2994392 RepID=UPI002F960D39